MAAVEFPPEVAGLLGRLRERLAARADVVGVYVYGSLVTGDYSPAASDIDVVTLMRREPSAIGVSGRRCGWGSGDGGAGGDQVTGVPAGIR